MNILLSLLLLTQTSNNELKLRNDLFSNYSSEIRPVLNHSLPVKVEMGIAVKNLEEFNQKVETLKLNLWLRMNWKNEYMVWNETEYGVDFLSINKNQVWVPDIELLNAASLPEIYTLKGGMYLYSDGSMMYSRPGIFKFSCNLKLEKFPYDTQTCKFIFSPWINSNKYLELKPYDDPNKAIDLLDSFSHSEWKLKEITYNKLIIVENNIDKDAIEYTIKLERFSHYYSLSIGMTMTLVYVSFIIMLVSPDNLSRTGTAVFIPLTILALQLTIADKVPVVGYYTLMDKFFLSCFVSSMFVSMESGIIYTIIVSNSLPFLRRIGRYLDINKYKNNSKHKENLTELKYKLNDIENIYEPEIEELEEKTVDKIEGPNKVYKIINYDDSYLNLTEDDIIIKDIIRRKIIFIDNIFRFLCPFVYTIYVAALIGNK